jgi:4-amino-4-deoxy-L-arabinose transferase-like glycosyltransferase
MEHLKGRTVVGEAFWVAGIVVAAFAVRLYFSRYHIVMVPDYDGADYINLARRVFTGGVFYGIFIPPGITALISLFLPFFDEPQKAGMAMSMVFGAGLTASVYLFTRELFGRRAALLAGALVAFFAQLVVASTWVMAEMPFAFFLYMGFYAGLVFLRRRDLKSALPFGASFGIAYLIRPEAFILFFMASALIAVLGWPGEASSRRRFYIGLALAALVMLVICSPYLLYLKGVTGRWTLSGKVEYNLAQGGESGQAAMSHGALWYFKEHGGELAGKYAQNLPLLKSVLKGAFPAALLLLSLIGMSASAFIGPRRPLGLLFPLVVLCFALMLPFFFIDIRILNPYYPALLVWAAAGAVLIEDKVFALTIFKPAARLYPLTAAIVLAAGFYCVSGLDRDYNSPMYRAEMEFMSARYLDTGHWLKANTEPRDKVMSRELLLVFYSGRQYVHLPDVTPERLRALAMEDGARYVIVDSTCVDKRKSLGGLLDPLVRGDWGCIPGFNCVYMNPYASVVIYRVEGVG